MTEKTPVTEAQAEVQRGRENIRRAVRLNGMVVQRAVAKAIEIRGKTDDLLEAIAAETIHRVRGVD